MSPRSGFGLRLRRGAWTTLALFGVGGLGCAATTPAPAATDDVRCVVSIQPELRLVTLAPPSGLQGGVTALFFKKMPEVIPGDLVRLEDAPGPGAPTVQTLETRAESCLDLARQAADHHNHH